MNIVPLQHLDIYEFFCDADLIDKVMPVVTGPDIFWGVADANDAYVSKHGYIDKRVPFYHPELFTWIGECIAKISEKHFNNVKLSITDSWLTKSSFGESSKYHYHSNSVISGLLYFSTFKKSGTSFTYKDPWREHISLFEFSNDNQHSITITPEKGKLIIWRSDLMHKIEPHTDVKSTRYTLAFNAFLDGSVDSSKTNMLTLQTKSVKQQYEEYMKNKNA